jgi:hypothetical protein
MALDVRTLSPTELVRLLNSTPLGTVISAARLHRQQNRAGYRIGDGKSIHFIRYAAWLAQDFHKRKRERSSPAEAYERHKQRMAERERMKALAGQDIGPVPDVADLERRERATASLRTFCETYFPQVFYRPWSDDHLRVIETMQRCVRDGGLFAFAMPRGSGKTSAARMAALWAILTGARRYVCLIGGSQDRAVELLLSIRRSILAPECDALCADFPEALYPLRALRNNARKQIGQHIDGEPTYCTWARDKLVFPTVTGERLPEAIRDLEVSPSSSSIITVTSLDANMRGQQHTRMDGSIVRPSLVLLDDPQTRESARSPAQTKYRFDLLNGDVLGMAGPGEKIAAFLACTKMYEDDLADQVLDRQKCPQWQGECTKLIYAWPTNEKLWDQYRIVRDESLRQGRGGKDATEFYADHRAAMDEGARAAWAARYNEDELSAVQHAVNLRCDMGDEAFQAEYQNEPASKQEHEAVMLTPQQVSERINGRPRGEVPLACTKLTAFVDVHKEVMFYCVGAWQDDFTGFVIDYGTFPDQGRSFFTLANARKTLSRAFPGAGEEGAMQAGLEELVSTLLQRSWPKAGGAGVLRIERLFVDMGYKPGVVAAVKHKAGGSAMMLSKGVGIRAGGKPISMYQRRPGWTLGANWYIPNVHGTSEFPHVCVDVNWWKSFVHEHLAVAPGDPGALTLFGKKPAEHHLFGEHVSGSETYVVTFGHGREVHEWRWRPERPDNHWLDCLVGCAAAASVLGVPIPGTEPAGGGRRRKRYTQSDLRR